MNKEQLKLMCQAHPGVTYDYQMEWQADRFFIGGKMYAMIGTDAKDISIITMKCDPERAETLRETVEGIVPGYYMNKTHWNSIYFDANVSSEMMESLIKHAYELVFNKLTKKQKQEIVG
ncbi:MAG: MmcQ/YjbR family DNA-binding protein [Candidatus Pristimantibacillus lignocellulolyticus]|uniref:MmcQ/YjbR family DNA-binding protein n=1 Tax=Candidatus Pristimantibacillus lignocellulolyticus TaxID=2994561 RepID=A0A9J6ZK02_9BACL|nr:MAG: MmcQ/YjbR family DNA-binding protein [Candidatus Pristimantibacillus lignocellulolyticus]